MKFRNEKARPMVGQLASRQLQSQLHCITTHIRFLVWNLIIPTKRVSSQHSQLFFFTQKFSLSISTFVASLRLPAFEGFQDVCQSERVSERAVQSRTVNQRTIRFFINFYIDSLNADEVNQPTNQQPRHSFIADSTTSLMLTQPTQRK